MGLHVDELNAEHRAALQAGGVIPAHPLALDEARRFDPLRQRTLSRYYIDAGVTGLAVGVHTTPSSPSAKQACLRPELRAAPIETQPRTGPSSRSP